MAGKKTTGGSALTLLCLALAACGGAPEKQRLTITGSSTLAPLAAELARDFEAAHPGVEIDVQSGGSSRGINDVRAGLAEIGMVSRAAKADEADLMFHTLALDGVAIIVNTANPVRALTREQIVDIYTGRIGNWSAAGGPDQSIVVVNKAEGRSTLELFLKFFELENPRIKASVVIGDNSQGLKTVAGNPWAIGYVSIGSAEYDAAHGQPIRLLPLDGVEASTVAVKEGRFPLSRPLNLVTRGEPGGLAREFIGYARSREAHARVEQQYFIPLADAR